jgi:hypothetical protein
MAPVRTRSRTATALGLSVLFALTGLCARADELSDLRADNDLLQQKLDQLAAFPGLDVGPARPFSEDETTPVPAAIQGSFPRSFLIPGTDTSIRIGGFINLTSVYYLQGGIADSFAPNSILGANGQVQTIGVGAASNAKGSNVFIMTAKESDLDVQTRTPTPFGEARTFMSFDWYGETAYLPGGPDPGAETGDEVPRVKYAYATLGGWLAGHANSNFRDADATAETLEFGGNVGEAGRFRTDQLRYTMPVAWGSGSALSVSIENPEVEVMTPNGICGSDAGVSSACVAPGPGVAALEPNPAKPVFPDFTGSFTVYEPQGHFNLSGVLRPSLGLSDGAYLSRRFIGGGGHVGLDYKPGWFSPKDDFTFQFEGGTGLGGYINTSTNVALETNFAAMTTGLTTGAHPASAVFARLVPSEGAEIGYVHWWTDTLRSNFNYGINHQNGLSAAILGPAEAAAANTRLQTAHVNLMWDPISFVTLGIEWMWGRRTVATVAAGLPNSNNMQALVSRIGVRF